MKKKSRKTMMISYKEALKQAHSFIEERDDFLVISHVNPDGDATGSVLAVAHLLRFLNKRFTVVNEGPTSARFAFLNGFEDIVDLSESPQLRTFRSVIAVDTADRERMGAIDDLLEANYRLLNIDHHPTNTLFGHINVIDSDAASTTQVLYEFIDTYYADAFNHPLAEALYTGLLTDTGGFRYSNTTQQVLQIAANLLTYDVSPSKIAEECLEKMTASHLELLKQSLQKLVFAFDNKVALLAVTQEDLKKAAATLDDADGLITYPRKIEGVEVAVLLKEKSANEVKASLRANNAIDVAKVAQHFGGGGHVKASGFTFHGTIDEAQQVLFNYLKTVLGDE